MRSVLVFLGVLFFFHSALSQQQSNDPTERVSDNDQEVIESQEELKIDRGLLFSDDQVHRYTCQRCGSENQLLWSTDSNSKNPELVPHCNFCGKKYWPKFKPANSVPRMYCRLTNSSVDRF